MKNYEKEIYLTKDSWLSNRGIGGSDAATILGIGKWGTIDELYNRVALGKTKKITENSKMASGTKAEDLIRKIYALDNPDIKVVSPPKNKYWLFRRKDQPLITCTPDGFIKGNKKYLGLEIKYVDLIKKEDKDAWESNVIPNQYYCQLLQYLIVINDLDGVKLDAHLKYYKHDDENDKWIFDFAVEKQYVIYREEVLKDLSALEKAEIQFIKNNVELKKRPALKIKL